MKVQIIDRIYFGFDVAFRSYMLFKEFFFGLNPRFLYVKLCTEFGSVIELIKPKHIYEKQKLIRKCALPRHSHLARKITGLKYQKIIF